METKRCSKCGEVKDVGEFGKNVRSPDGYKFRCRVCTSEDGRIYRENNTEKIKISKQKSHIQNAEKNNKRGRLWRLKNIGKAKEWHRKYNYNRYHSCNNYKLEILLRTRLSNALRGQVKKSTTLILLGCNIDYLKQHLEGQFTTGMNWDNNTFEGWHIDHIKPCASFDLRDPEQQKQCFHYSNLQPLWAFDNLSKGDKYKELS